MWMDVVDLRDFYSSPLGGVARRMIRRRIRALWPDCKDMKILGLGYTTPYLGLFRSDAERTLAFMPSSQGVLHWPNENRSLTTLVDEADLPLDDVSVDRVLIVHAVECTEQLRSLLREAWRVLNGSGKVLIVVPNRRGVWARMERTPFGFGRPYSPRQLNNLLRDNMFTPLRSDHALFVPPSKSRMILGSAPAWENIGRRFFPGFAGVCLIEATKQIYAANTGTPARARRRPIVALPSRQSWTSHHNQKILNKK
ncbi:methyltransferase domain-containing protein [Terasakiella sp. A23]|uniref:class I SAM-dependent methyltransferase n=1 Tax=Terasakiella sp. FCG-A23 TaxID=3080561 RepID=UPI0029535735|nr:methyltransferase domain-containing protein [Terasakiella sp. A23]MDV7339511.1 methyltransferase domain-containing protein [Terasakiella sp. A23]